MGQGLHHRGFSYGKELAEFFVTRLGKDYLKTNFGYTLGILAATGWGVPELLASIDMFPNITITLQSCLECEGVRAPRPTCNFMRGFLAGVSSTIAGHVVHCEEPRCIARGNHSCEFVLHSGTSTINR